MDKKFFGGELVVTNALGSVLRLGFHPETQKPWRSEAEAMGYSADFSRFYFSPPEPDVPVVSSVSPVEFKLLFTSAERLAIKELRQTDAVVDDFYQIVDDPRLTMVRLDLASTRDAIDHLVGAGVLTAERADQVKAGELQ